MKGTANIREQETQRRIQTERQTEKGREVAEGLIFKESLLRQMNRLFINGRTAEGDANKGIQGREKKYTVYETDRETRKYIETDGDAEAAVGPRRPAVYLSLLKRRPFIRVRRSSS